MGIKPIHRNGWILVGIFWAIEAPLMFAAFGPSNLDALWRFAAGAAFIGLATVMFAIVFWKFRDYRSD